MSKGVCVCYYAMLTDLLQRYHCLETQTMSWSSSVFSYVSVCLFPKTNDLDGVCCVCEARGSHTCRGWTTSSMLGTGTVHTPQVASFLLFIMLWLMALQRASPTPAPKWKPVLAQHLSWHLIIIFIICHFQCLMLFAFCDTSFPLNRACFSVLFQYKD